MSRSGNEYSLEECKNAYDPVIEELLRTKEGKSPLRIILTKENGFADGTEPDVDVYIKKLDSYDHYSFNGFSWEDLTNSSIENPDFLDFNNAIAEILWELTFDGWTEKEQMEFYKELCRLKSGDIEYTD